MLDLDAFAASVVGVPFLEHGRDRAGMDCWSLIVLAYREVYGIELPDLGGQYDRAAATPELAQLVMREKMTCWREVVDPQPGDVAVLRIAGLPVHVALVLSSSLMLHVHQGTETCVERYASPAWQRRIDGFFRHVDRRG